MKTFFISFFLFLVLLTCNASALGLGANPAYLEFTVNSENDLNSKIHVINNGEEKLNFNLYSDSNAVNVSHHDFFLEAGNSRTVSVKLNPARFKEGFKATLFVLASNPSDLNIKAGIKIPLTIRVFNKKFLEKYPQRGIIEKRIIEENVEKQRQKTIEKYGTEENKNIRQNQLGETLVTGLFSLGTNLATFLNGLFLFVTNQLQTFFSFIIRIINSLSL